MLIPTLACILAPVCSPTAAAPTPQQLVARSTEVIENNLPKLEIRGLASHPFGGVAFAAEGRSVLNLWGEWGGATQAAVGRLDDEGRLAWLETVPVAGPTEFGMPFSRMAVLNDGAIAAVFGQTTLLVFEPDGGLRWSRVLPNVAGLGCLGAAGAADVLVYYHELGSDPSVPIDRLATAVRLDGATGADVWRRNWNLGGLPLTDWFTANAAIFDETICAAQKEPAGSVRLLKVDANGDTLSVATDIFPETATTSGPIAVSPTGEVAVAYVPEGFAVVDASGTVMGRSTDQPSRLQFSPNGDLLGIVGHPRCYEPSGAVRWSLPSLTGSIEIFGMTNGDVRLTRVSGSFQSRRPRTYLISSAGQVLRSLLLESEDTPPEITTTLPVDENGEQWIARAYVRSTRPYAVRNLVSRVSLDSLVEQVTCTPTALNSAGEIGQLTALGSRTAQDNDVTLFVSNLPAGQTVLFLNARQAGSVPSLGGGVGTLCLGGSINRYVGTGQVTSANPLGQAWLRLDLTAEPQGATTVPAMGGETWYYQAWYRDVLPSTAATSDLTEAIRVTYL